MTETEWNASTDPALIPEPVCPKCVEAAGREERWKEIIADGLAETFLLCQAAGLCEQAVRGPGRAVMDLLIGRVESLDARIATLEVAGSRLETILQLLLSRLAWRHSVVEWLSGGIDEYACRLSREEKPNLEAALVAWRQARGGAGESEA